MSLFALFLGCGTPAPDTTGPPSTPPVPTAPTTSVTTPTTPVTTPTTPPTTDSTPIAATGDTGGSSTGGTTLPAGLNGSVPASPIGLPTFVATNRDGTTRTEADLIGHPTAVWFYPAAASGG